jgi:hypothetical protein
MNYFRDVYLRGVVWRVLTEAGSTLFPAPFLNTEALA